MVTPRLPPSGRGGRGNDDCSAGRSDDCSTRRNDARAVGTVVDTLIFVVLVGVAVGVLAGINPQPTGVPDTDRRLAGETADVLSTATTTVPVERTGSVTTPDGPVTVAADRELDGTYASLLATAAVANATLGGQRVTNSSALVRPVTSATRRALPSNRTTVEVRAQWRPYRDAPLSGTTAVGRPPPADADVSVATATVPSGHPAVDLDPRNVSRYDRVATAVADSVVTGLFPPDRGADALASEGPDRVLVADRYRTVADRLGTSVDDPLAAGRATAANCRLVRALAAELRADLSARFDSPAAAARATSTDRARIVVRVWSP